MKKFLLLVGTLSLILGLTGCFGTDDPDPDPDPVALESVVLSGFEDHSIMIGDEFNVFLGIVATGSDDVDYSDLITVASDDCYIDPDGDLDTSAKGDCIIDYTVVVEGKLDRASVTVTIEKEAIVVDPNDPVLKEWTFDTDADLLGWNIYEASPGSVVASIDNETLKLVTTTGTNVWDARYSYMGIPFQQGTAYTITFDAKSSVADKVINVQVGELLSGAPYFTNFKPDQPEHFTLTTEWATYSFTFLMELDNVDGGLLFEMGNVDDSIGIDADIWYDNVKIFGGGGDDTVAPAITCADDITVFVGDVFYPMVGVSAFDFVDQYLTPSIVLAGDTVDMMTAGVYTLTYTVSDAAENETIVTRVVTVLVDDVAPVITGTGDVVITLGIAFDELTDVTATDNRDGDLTADIVLGGDVLDIDVAGEYSVTYTVEDEKGNTVTETRLITVSAMLFDDTNLVLNGTFDASAWETWMANWNATDATLDITGGQAVWTVVDTGDANWNIQFKQTGIELTQDQAYVLTFDAMSSVDRDIKAKFIALDGTEFFEVISLTNTMTTYTVVFTFNILTQEGKIDFELGLVDANTASTVTFDNVMLEEHDGTDAVAGTDMVVNGDFELNDLNDWAHYERNWAPIITGTLEVVDGVAVYTYDGVGDATWNTKIQQFDIDLQFGETYILTFDAKGDAARPFTGVFYDGATNWVTPLYDLTTEWQTFEYVFTYNGQALPRMEFLMGNRGPATGGVFYLDNVSIGVLQQDAMLINGDFSGTGWKTFTRSWAPVITSTFEVIDEVAVYTYDGIGDATWNAKVIQYDIPLVNGTTYQLTFDAKGDVAKEFKITFYDGVSFTNFAPVDPFNLTADWKTFTFVFTYDKDDMPRMEFLLGAMGPIAGGVFYLDNVMVEEWDGTAVVAGTDVVVNGTFDQPVEWGAWYGDQWSGATTSSAIVIDGGLEVTVAGLETTMAAYATQIYQEGFTVEKGITYTIEFDAYADDARQMNIQLGDALSYDPWFLAFMTKSTVDLTTTSEHFVITFTMTEDTNDEGKLVFELGAIDGVAVNTTVYIDNVIIYANYNPIVED